MQINRNIQSRVFRVPETYNWSYSASLILGVNVFCSNGNDALDYMEVNVTFFHFIIFNFSSKFESIVFFLKAEDIDEQGCHGEETSLNNFKAL